MLCPTVGNADVWGNNPWVEVGRSSLRSDIQILADAGVIEGPVSTWPLSWGDISNQLDVSQDLTPYQMAALTRVRKAANTQTEIGKVDLHARAAFAENPIEIRSFEYTPREDYELEAGFSWTGSRFAVRLVATYVDDPLDGDEWRGDGSYIGVALGNWTLAGSIQDRWYGPGWQSNLILSSNARPIPAFTLDRNSTHEFGTKWLSWLGPWDLSVMYGFMEEERAVPNPRFFGMRFNFRPLKSLEIGLSRTAMWCGEGRPCDFEAFLNMLLGKDNRGDNVSAEDEPGNQLAGYDLRWNYHLWQQPFALYAQFIGEDEDTFIPTDWLGQIGGETWGQWGSVGTYRMYLEWADTECDFTLWRSIRNDTGPGSPNCAYNNKVYPDGYRYKGRSIGHTFDNDSSIFTLGGMLGGSDGNSWLATFGIGNLNRHGEPDPANTVAQVKTRYRELNLMHRRSLPIGDIHLGVGYEYRKNTVTSQTEDNVHLFLEWQQTY